MDDYIILNGDMLQITMTPPTVVPSVIAPLPLVGTGVFPGISLAQTICIDGDEMPPPLKAPQPYMDPVYSVPGMGMFKITLMPNHKTMVTKCMDKAILLKGATIMIEFTVTVPAMMPPPASTPDPVVKKMATGQFITMNTLIKAG
ncbi:MAG: hypothetical protein ACKVU1_12800 [bacterium]